MKAVESCRSDTHSTISLIGAGVRELELKLIHPRGASVSAGGTASIADQCGGFAALSFDRIGKSRKAGERALRYDRQAGVIYSDQAK